MNVLLSVDSYRQQYTRKIIIYNLLNRLHAVSNDTIKSIILLFGIIMITHIDMVGNDQQLHLHIFQLSYIRFDFNFLFLYFFNLFEVCLFLFFFFFFSFSFFFPPLLLLLFFIHFSRCFRLLF